MRYQDFVSPLDPTKIHTMTVQLKEWEVSALIRLLRRMEREYSPLDLENHLVYRSLFACLGQLSQQREGLES